eukprot:scaffold3672_cov66-Phaeocystis_antarctica.AAC.1
MTKVCASTQRHAASPTGPRSHAPVVDATSAPQPPYSRLRTTRTPNAHFWPGDRAQDEQPTLQAGPSHTGAHDAVAIAQSP